MQGAQCVRRVVSARVLARASALALCAALVAPSAARAAPSGTLSMSPASASISVGQTISVTLNINGAAGLHEADLFVLYNPGVVQPVDADSATSGTQILPGPFPGGGAVTANAAAGGTIQYSYTLPASVEASGSGTLATVQFQAVGNGNAGLSWGSATLIDASFNEVTPAGSEATLTVGAAAAAVTDTPVGTSTAVPSSTATSASTATTTPAPSATATAAASTPTVAASGTATRTPSVTSTAAASVTPHPSATPRLTALRVDGTPTRTINQKLGVDGAGTKPQSSLPNAGNGGPGVQWWRWTFFGAALMLGVAGWFFTFALHHSDRDVVLLDRHDRRRRRRY